MHPAFYGWWKSAHRRGHGHGCEHRVGGPGCHGHADAPFEARFGGPGDEGFGHGGGGGGLGGSFGVRRPLRFLAHKLDLSEPQVAELARIIDELKTERAQAEVDHRRTVAAFADAVEGGAFGEERAREGGDLRVKSAERLRDAVTKALSRMHAVLDDDQRKRFAYLIRTGVLSL